MKARRAFLYVQHLLGIGHLRRTATLANALAAEGVEVTLASGGFPVPGLRLEGVRLVQLPPAGAADASFKTLVGIDGRPVDERWKSARRDQLLEAWRTADPHVLMIELYPFGRRQLRFELVPLLEAAAGTTRRPVIVCSVRDILGGGQKNPQRQDEMLEVFERYFDQVLVHGDPAVIPFERTFRHTGRLRTKLHYTGYVVDPSPWDLPTGPPPGESEADEVIVSAGGGAVGLRLLETAIHARPFSRLSKRTWRILAGVNAAGADLQALACAAAARGEGRVVVERARADFTTLLSSCAVSVSQGGYNTMLELLQARARSVVVPFGGGNEIEQTLRARAFAERGLAEVVEEEALSPQALAAAVDRAAARPRPRPDAIDLRGASRGAALLAAWSAGVAW